MHRLNEMLLALGAAQAAAETQKGAYNALLDEQATTKATYLALVGKKAAATDGKLSDEDAAKFDKLKAAHEGFDGRLSAARTLVLEAEKSATAASQALEAEKQRVAAEDAAALAKAGTTRVEVGLPNHVAAPHGGFETFGARLQAVIKAADHSKGMPDQRLLAGPTGLGETVPSDGGYAVGVDQGLSIMQRVYDTGNILGRVKRIPISANSNGIKLPAIDETSRADGSRSGGIRAYWVEEAGTITASQPKIRQNSLTLHKVAAVVYLTDELQQDASALEAWVMQNLPGELTFKIEDAIVNGDGVGKPQGWINSNAVVSVAKNSGQLADTFDYTNAVKMWSRMYAPSRRNALWLINQDVEPQLYQMSLAVGTGGAPVFMPAGGASESPFATLFGRPIVPAEYCSTLGDVGDVQLVDPSQYTLIDKGGVQVASSIHVQFLTDQNALRFLMRVDGLPDWNAPLAPKNGAANTLSPFVTLASR